MNDGDIQTLGDALAEIRFLRQEITLAQIASTARDSEFRRLEQLIVRKNEALAIVAHPTAWGQTNSVSGGISYYWRGINELADPMAWAKIESEAEEPN